MQIPLLKHQKAFVTTQAPYPAISGGLGSGKTGAATMRLLIKMVQDPGINTLLGMPTYDLLKLRAMPGIEEELTRIGIPYKVNKSDYEIKILGYGSIYFRSYDRPERWVAFEVAHTILDELDTLPHEKAEFVWRKANERTRQKCKGINTIGNVTTPDMGIHGFTYFKWVKEKKPGYELIYASTYDNFFLPDGYIDQIKANYDPLMAEAYLLGRFMSFNDKKVYHFFDRKRHHSDREIQEGDRLHIGLDFNVGGTCATTWVIDSNKPIAVDEFVSHDTQDFVNNLSRYKDHNLTIYPDASGGSSSTNASATDIDIIRRAGYAISAPEKNPFVRDRVNAMNALLSHDAIAVNTNKCPELTNALEVQGYTDKGEPEKFNTHPAIDDWLDGAGYFIHQRYPIRTMVAAPAWSR